MSSRFAPHRIRARYLRALKSMPMPVSLADPPDPARLTVLGTETVAGRTVRFGTVASAPRLWMAFSETAETVNTANIVEPVGTVATDATADPHWPDRADESGEAGESGGAAGLTEAAGLTGPMLADPSAMVGVSAPRTEAAEHTGPLLGYVTGLVVGEPDLWVCEAVQGAHRDWVFDEANSRELKRAATRVWFSRIKNCEG